MCQAGLLPYPEGEPQEDEEGEPLTREQAFVSPETLVSTVVAAGGSGKFTCTVWTEGV